MAGNVIIVRAAASNLVTRSD